MPAIGELNRRVLFRRRTDYATSDMGLDAEYSDQRYLWARIRQVGGETYQGSVQTGNVITHRITIRYRDDITADFEIVHKKRVYRVKKITELAEGGRFLMIEAEELGATYGNPSEY